MKNSVESDNYVLFSRELTETIGLSGNYQSKWYNFKNGDDTYDGKQLAYLFSVIDNNNNNLKLKPFATAIKVVLKKAQSLIFEKEFPVSAKEISEYITNYSFWSKWLIGVDEFNFNEK